jgi:hypothetical protein
MLRLKSTDFRGCKAAVLSPGWPAESCKITLLFKHFGVITCDDRAERGPRRTIMTTFTIDTKRTKSQRFRHPRGGRRDDSPPPSTPSPARRNLAELAAAWPAERLVAIWNSLAGVVAVEKFKSPKAAISRIWTRIQSLGEAAKPKRRPRSRRPIRRPRVAHRAPRARPRRPRRPRRPPPPRTRPRPGKPPRRRKAPGRARAARRPRWWRCCSARAAPRSRS